MSNNSHTINIFQYPKNGTLNLTYSPLQNLIKSEKIGNFTTSNLTYKLSKFLNIDTQLSYDDSINLILNNDEETPRIINSQFRVLGNNTYEYLTRNQGLATNLYKNENIKTTTDLFLRSSVWPIIDLIDVKEDGTLMGGNYVFYIKYCDEDFNETEIVSESGTVSIFKGNSPSTASGTLLDERTSKSIELNISNLDKSFNKFFLYFSRETSDLNGISLTKYYKINDPYTIDELEENIFFINGYESIIEIGYDELFIKYNYFTSAKTQAIVQNMLFLGNVRTSEKDYPKLQQLSYRIKTTLKQRDESIGYVNSNYSINLLDNNTEYYDPKNIYYYLGYWPDEYYQLGICYILNDGTTSQAFALHGGKLTLNEPHIANLNDDSVLEVNKLLNENDLSNTGGIFKLPKVEIINHVNKSIYPLYFEFTIDKYTLKELNKLGVQGYFFVRTKRIPTSLFQGLSVGIDESTGLAMPYITTGVKTQYTAEAFINAFNDSDGKTDKEDVTSRILEDNIDKHLRNLNKDLITYSALLSVDPIINTQLQSILSWSKYMLDGDYTCKIESSSNSRLYSINTYELADDKRETSLVFINENIPSFWIEGKYFSTRAGNAESVSEFAFLGSTGLAEKEDDNLIRGIYSPMVGSNILLKPSTIYTVKTNLENEKGWITSLLNNPSQYFSITNRYKIPENIISDIVVKAYRGDCFTNTVSIRLNRNFIDTTFPANNKIVDKYTWYENFGGIAETKMMNSDTEKNKDKEYVWNNINIGDLNAVPLGQWITFKCLSNYNLGLRSIDKRDVGMMGKLGSNGSSFYPISGFNTSANGKMPESQVLNNGYSITLPRKSYFKWIPSPYENWNFENRIAFSNIASTKMFTNGFRVFQGLAYQDVDKQFGQIIKLFPYGQNLLCVFEHGLAIVPINEKALLSTQEGLSIHLYGAGVLQEQVSVISPDYGSTWMESLIKTPDAYYGVDTSAKKIWKFNNTEGFQCISDFKMQSFLNENLNIDWDDKFFIGATNVRTHYNNFKGDVIFTFYNEDNAYSLCYNERMKMWVSRYSWMPLLSANIDNQFYSFDRDIIAKYTKIWKQAEKKNGIICEKPFYNDDGDIPLHYEGILSNVDIQLDSVKINGVIWNKSDSFVPIVANNEIQGMYYKHGVENFIHEGGSISTTNNLSLYNKPLKWLNLRRTWGQIVQHDVVDTLKSIEYEDNTFLFDCILATSNKVGNITYTSSVPIVKYESEDDDGNIDFIDHELYSAYTYIDENGKQWLHLPNLFDEVEITLSAQCEGTTLETYNLIIGTISSDSLYLYKHDINANICYWYDRQHPFEYEFVVNQPAGFHKIFNNLMIISNNVEPESLEVEIIGDSYDFKEEFVKQTDENIKYKFPIISLPENKIYQTKLTFDKVTNENKLLMHQDCLNIKDFGRRLGNISYIEGKWYVVLQPIYYEDKTLKTTRLRDKWAKIRIKYSGEKLAIITAIQTLMNISYV